MGQQQLLLLVLATVIVGLATVAGIQAFGENQRQAAKDALIERGTTILSDVKGHLNKPSELGGIDYSDKPRHFLDRMGYENDSMPRQSMVPVEGVPGGGRCELIFDESGKTAGVICEADAAGKKDDLLMVLNYKGNGEIRTRGFYEEVRFW